MLILPSRRQFLTGIGAGAGLLAATGVYAFDIEPLHRLVVTRYAPTLPRWDAALRLRVAVLADFHICEPFMPLDRVAEIVDATNALKPDLVLMLGDYPAGRIAWRKLPLAEFARLAEGLKAPLGTYSILGNHDWWDDEAVQRSRRGTPEVKRLLEGRGIPVLENGAVRLVKDGRPFWIGGVAEQQPFYGFDEGFDDVPATLSAVTDDAPVLLMAHEPDVFIDVPDRVSLTLAGHTHGGQVRLLGVSPASRRFRFRGHDLSYGHVVVEGRHLIVSGGFGVSRLPVRLGVPPEIVLLDLGTEPAAV